VIQPPAQPEKDRDARSAIKADEVAQRDASTHEGCALAIMQSWGVVAGIGVVVSEPWPG